MSYSSKAKDSFKTKMNLFLYDRVVQSKPEFTLNDFKEYEIHEEMVKDYVTVYWQENKEHTIRGKKIGQIETEIKRLESMSAEVIKQCENYYVNESFPKLFPKGKFEELVSRERCYYCGISRSEIVELGNQRKLRKKNFRGWNLEIDRLDSNYEYTPKNCEMCCYWCNNAKTDEFTSEEFKAIGDQIKIIWEQRRRRIDRFTGDGSEISTVRKP